VPENLHSPCSSREGPPSPTKRYRIFVTVGTDLPFSRLVNAVDEWAARNERIDIFAQVGTADQVPRYIAYDRFLEPQTFNRLFQEADYIISHAGMGTILSSLRYEKPLLVMPRKASLGEHRNEHQLATAKYLDELKKVNIATDERHLIELLDKIDELPVREKIGPYASASLTRAIRDFIEG